MEESVGRLWESFPPARLVSGLFTSNLEAGFIVSNIVLVAFGVWCAAVPVRRGWRSAVLLMCGWTAIELINGVGHPLWSLRQRGYTPGVATAPVLFVIALLVLRQIVRDVRES